MAWDYFERRKDTSTFGAGPSDRNCINTGGAASPRRDTAADKKEQSAEGAESRAEDVSRAGGAEIGVKSFRFVGGEVESAAGGLSGGVSVFLVGGGEVRSGSKCLSGVTDGGGGVAA